MRTGPVITVLIPLPVEYNPDKYGRRKPVEDAKFERTANEVATHFQGGGAIWKSRRGGTMTGYWWNKGVVDLDTNALLELDMHDTKENRQWILRYAEKVLLKRFKQEAIYVRFVSGTESYLIRRVAST